MERAAQKSILVSEEALSRFILDKIDSVPHLEALLLLWHNRPRAWLKEEMAARLFVQPGKARSLLEDLVRHTLAAKDEDEYRYASSAENDRVAAGIAEAYRTDLIRISTAIHSKASRGVLEFARAFDLTRNRNK